MAVKEALNRVIGGLPDDRVREIYDFARFLEAQDEQTQWQRFGQSQLARAYGPDEGEYSERDIAARQQHGGRE